MFVACCLNFFDTLLTHQIKKPLKIRGLRVALAVWTGLEPATPCVTGRYSNQTELPDHFFHELPLKKGLQK